MPESSKLGHGLRSTTVSCLSWAIEVSTIVLVCASPWAFGAIEAECEFLLYLGLAILLAMWGGRTLLQGEVHWARCPATLCLAGLFLLGVWQLLPLSQDTLRWLAPATGRLYGELLPAQHELVPGDPQDSTSSARTALSLYPVATRREVVRLLGVFLLFVVVRNTSTGSAALRRLSIVALINCSLLAYLGIAQFFSSPPNTLYWRIQSTGLVFGPFINRNHYAMYVNVCVGLGLGLLLYAYMACAGSIESKRTTRAHAWSHLTRAFASEPKVLWTGVALAIVVASSFICLSRGGVLSLAGASLGCILHCSRKPSRSVRLEIAIVPIALTLGWLSWFGLEPVQDRLGTIWGAATAAGGRGALWRDAIRVVWDFLPWGTGYGTYQYIEPLYRTSAEVLLNEHVHNEYLEAAVEGGLVRLALTLCLIGVVARFGAGSLRHHDRTPVGGLVLGALLGLGTVVLHSFVEFGIHVPAIAVLVTVVSAHLCVIGSTAPVNLPLVPGTTHAGVAEPRYRMRWAGIAPAIATCLALSLGAILVQEGWTGARVQFLRRLAGQTSNGAHILSAARRIKCLEAAEALAPDLARVQVELARLHLDLSEPDSERLAGTLDQDEQAIAPPEDQPSKDHLATAISHYLRARDSCPLLAEPHRVIAANVAFLERAEPAMIYLNRATRLMPNDPELWFACGMQELLDGGESRVWKCWRRSLELSDAFLPTIVDVAAATLGDDGLVSEVLPEQPEVIVRAALRRYPSANQAEERRPFFRKAHTLMREQGMMSTSSADRAYLEATVHRGLCDWKAARAAYRFALRLQPGQITWRYELASMLFDQGELDESYRELATLLQQRPDHDQARLLMNQVSRQRDVKHQP